MARQTERQKSAEFRTKLLEYAKATSRYVHYHKIADSGAGNYSQRPYDAYLVVNGRFLAIEFKQGAGKLTPRQIMARDNVLKAGGEFIVIRFMKTNVIVDNTVGIRAVFNGLTDDLFEGLICLAGEFSRSFYS